MSRGWTTVKTVVDMLWNGEAEQRIEPDKYPAVLVRTTK